MDMSLTDGTRFGEQIALLQHARLDDRSRLRSVLCDGWRRSALPPNDSVPTTTMPRAGASTSNVMRPDAKRSTRPASGGPCDTLTCCPTLGASGRPSEVVSARQASAGVSSVRR
jgi:hypothetical protein